MIIVPITNQPNQDLTVTIPRPDTNIVLRLFLYWNRIAGYWQMSITNVITDTLLIESLPMITGDIPYPNLLQQFQYMEIGNAYVVPLSSRASNYPGVSDWGTNFTLMWE